MSKETLDFTILGDAFAFFATQIPKPNVGAAEILLPDKSGASSMTCDGCGGQMKAIAARSHSLNRQLLRTWECPSCRYTLTEHTTVTRSVE